MKIDDEIQKAEKKIANLELQLSIQTGVLAHLKALSVEKSRKSSRSKKGGPPREGSLAAQIQDILKGSDGPLSVAEIVQSLKDQGFSSDAKVSLNNLVPSSITRRKDIFYRVRYGVYDLVSRKKEIFE